jgi:hypothetical protein
MRKRLLCLLSFVATGVAFSQTLPNGGFENWNVTNYNEPQFAFTSNYGRPTGPLNAVQTTDAFHGSYAIKLTTVALSGTSFLGYVAYGNPGSGATGGIPYTQMAKGLRLYYKSTILGTDSAVIIVQFKKGGASVGMYIYTLGASKSTYTLFSPSFSPALTVAPDTVIFAAASSNPYVGNGTPGNMLQVDSVSFTGVTSQPAQLNGDFELWTPMTNDMLYGWQQSSPNATSKQTTDALSGNYALELVTIRDLANNIDVGNVVSGGSNNRGNPYSTLSDTLIFSYKYVPGVVTDSAMIYVITSKNGSNVGHISKALGASASYKTVKLPIVSSQTPDTLAVSLVSTNLFPPTPACVGSDLKVDNMYLKSQPLFVREVVSNVVISLQPNPNNGVFTLITRGLTGASAIEKVEIYDMCGSLVEQKLYPGGSASVSEEFDISRLNAGIYLVQISTNSGVICKKVSKTN